VAAAITNAAERIFGRGHGGAQIELAPVVGRNIALEIGIHVTLRNCQTRVRQLFLHAGVGKAQQQIGERLVAALAVGNTADGIVHQRCGGGDLARAQKAADFRKRFASARVGAVARAAVPDRVLVKLDAVTRDIAKDHRAEPAVADRQRACPVVLRGLVVPEHERAGRERRHKFRAGRRADSSSTA